MTISSFFPDLLIPEIPVGQCLMDALDKYGDKVALIEMHTDRKITFNEMKEKALHLTKIFWKAGLRKGDIVGLVVPLEIKYVPLLIAIVNCGAVVFGCKLLYRWSIYKQLNEIKPFLVIAMDERIEEVMKETSKISDIKACISFSKLDHLEANSLRSEFDLPYYNNIDVHNDPVVIYQSSGTTGKPKGILHTHHSIISTIEIGRNSNQLLPGSVIAKPLSHISVSSFTHILQNLVAGVQLCFAPVITGELFYKYVTKYKVTLFGTSDLSCLLDIANNNKHEVGDLSSLTGIMVGGTIFPANTLQKVSEKLNGIQVSSMYAMSECFWITSRVCTTTSPFNSVGFLTNNTKIKILSSIDGHECGSNEKGEIFVKSPAVMKGYYSSDKTDTYGLVDGWLPTGDYGYYDQDNCVYICSRIKDMLKTPPSFTAVMPIEFEEILLMHELVKDAVVLAVPHSILREVAKAFVVRKDESLSENELLRFFSSKVESLLSLDGGVEFIDVIPRTETGKPLRRELLESHMKKMSDNKFQ